MNRRPVDSTNLLSVGYDSADGILEVEFRNGRVYEYYRVPEAIYERLLTERSPGEFFSQHIKDQYRFRRVL